MNKNMIEQLENYKDKISVSDFKKIEKFFVEFEKKVYIEQDEKNELKNDFIKVILFYLNNDYSVEEILKLLDLKDMGKFYCNKSKETFELDDFAKIILPSNSEKFTFMCRASVYLKGDIISELLQMALNFTIIKFPLFATKLRKTFGGYKFEVNRKHYTVEPDNNIICKPINFKEKDYQLFRVLYKKNKITLEFCHILSDGTGGGLFFEILIFEYLKLVEKQLVINEDNDNIIGCIGNDELENAFENITLNDEKTYFENKIYLTPQGNKLKKELQQVINIKLDSEKLKKLSKKYNTTVTGYLTSAMFIANKAVTNNQKGYTNVYLSVNLRNYYQTKTIRNFCTLCNICMKNEEISEFSSLIENINKQLKTNLTPEAIKKPIINTKKVVSLSRYLPFWFKKILSKTINNTLSNKYYTNELSNLGEVKFSDNISKYIESMEVILDVTVIAKISCAVITTNNITTFSILKNIDNNAFEEELYKQFLKDDIILN